MKISLTDRAGRKANVFRTSLALPGHPLPPDLINPAQMSLPFDFTNPALRYHEKRDLRLHGPVVPPRDAPAQ